MKFPIIGPALLLAASAGALRFWHRMDPGPNPALDRRSVEPLPVFEPGVNGTNGWDTFDQLIDHSTPSKGTVKQRYWYILDHWSGSRSPVILINPGELSAEGLNNTYATAQQLQARFAQATGAAIIILEHRYFSGGGSSPVENFTVANLQYLTLENNIKDNFYFAQNVVLPFEHSTASHPQNAPWILSGGSRPETAFGYAGALVAWTAAKDTDNTFWAYHASSAAVQVTTDFWCFFDPVIKATPENCTADQIAVIEYVDEILLQGDVEQKHELKSMFMLEDLEDGDFAAALPTGPWRWKTTKFYTESQLGYSPYYQFCDYVENVWPNSTNQAPGPEGVGQNKALKGYAKWFTEVELPGTCDSQGYKDWQRTYNTGCYQNPNASMDVYKDVSTSNSLLAVNWLLCNEPLEWSPTGAPEGYPTIVSRAVNISYRRSLCPIAFPPEEGGYGLMHGRTVDDVNKYTGGWFIDKDNVTRLMMANGGLDPWREATMSAESRPNGPKASTYEMPIRVIAGGMLSTDIDGRNWEVNAEVDRVVRDEVENMKEWVDQFYAQKHA